MPYWCSDIAQWLGTCILTKGDRVQCPTVVPLLAYLQQL
uniref:Uncharacterized protein n=1 Tax=Ciona intestinalis TaxID=7719 RepID=H2XK71_CIOIN